MKNRSITATAHPNIAFIKYWGNVDQALRLPSNGSISMNLASLTTTTTATINPKLKKDQLVLNGYEQTGPVLTRVKDFLDQIRTLYKKSGFLAINSINDFPTSAGIASSASGFAALAAAAANLLELGLSTNELSGLARLGSGSACRSIPGGFTEWKTGEIHQNSYAISIAPEDYWNLWDCIAVVQSKPKSISSTQGHHLANSSPLQSARIKDAPRRLDICRNAIIQKDFIALAEVIELDSNIMHAVMMTSNPGIFYWQPTSLEIMQTIRDMRQKGIAAAYTLDAGPNVHVICEENDLKTVEASLLGMKGLDRLIKSAIGAGVRITSVI